MEPSSERRSAHPCPACASSSAEFARGGGRAYFLCPSCALAFLDPSMRPSPEEERKRYLLHDNGPGNSGYASYLDSFIESWVQPFLPSKPSLILDYGSGPYPLLAKLLATRGHRAIAWDPAFAPSREGFPLSFDLVVAHEVLEHCQDPLSALRDIGGLLRPGGVLAASTLFRPRRAEDFLSWWYRQDSTHLSFFSEDCLRGLCARAGLAFLRGDGRSRSAFRRSAS